jgi:GMP synthase-like glutamine amidotransferase
MSEPDKLPFFVIGEYDKDHRDSCVGQIQKGLADEKRSFTYVKRGKRMKPAFSPDQYAGLIMLGESRFYTTDERERSPQEREWLKAAMDNNKPVLGICYGAQLMAVSLDKSCLASISTEANSAIESGRKQPICRPSR